MGRGKQPLLAGRWDLSDRCGAGPSRPAAGDVVLRVVERISQSMSQSKREQVVSHLRYIRQELREMHQGVMEDGLLPEAGEVRGVMAQMEALLELLEGKGSRKKEGDG